MHTTEFLWKRVLEAAHLHPRRKWEDNIKMDGFSGVEPSNSNTTVLVRKNCVVLNSGRINHAFIT
jgi:hypothetical protein